MKAKVVEQVADKDLKRNLHGVQTRRDLLTVQRARQLENSSKHLADIELDLRKHARELKLPLLDYSPGLSSLLVDWEGKDMAFVQDDDCQAVWIG